MTIVHEIISTSAATLWYVELAAYYDNTSGAWVSGGDKIGLKFVLYRKIDEIIRRTLGVPLWRLLDKQPSAASRGELTGSDLALLRAYFGPGFPWTLLTADDVYLASLAAEAMTTTVTYLRLNGAQQDLKRVEALLTLGEVEEFGAALSRAARLGSLEQLTVSSRTENAGAPVPLRWWELPAHKYLTMPPTVSLGAAYLVVRAVLDAWEQAGRAWKSPAAR